MPKVPVPILVVEVPRPFPYESQKAIPQDYNYTHQTVINDLTGVEGNTRSGHCYAPDIAEKVAFEKLSVLVNKELPFKENEQFSRKKKGKNKEAPESTSRPVTEREASKFLKFIKHSEYSVIEQLNKTSVRISLLSLFQNSETHRNTLLKALGEVYVTSNIFIKGIDQLVGNITAGACIAFTD